MGYSPIGLRKEGFSLTEDTIVRAKSLAQQAYHLIREAILSGRLQPGERFIESRWAMEWNISRSPVREAVRVLVAEGLLQENGNGYEVFRPSLQDFHDLYEMRLAIEAMAARLAAERMKEPTLVKLQENVEQTQRAVTTGDGPGIISYNTEFHLLIVESTNNSRLIHSFQSYTPLIDYYCLLVLTLNQQQTDIVAEHQAVVNALRAKQATDAYERMFLHIRHDLTVIERM